ncbi:MAG TPA: class I SAM-dependent methyltransferase, partial [Pyrinomonadaceae bacterium]|nr:class I SAM-dependent methyltransferase [Pyrinomonadaceae bacterium]
HRKKVELLLGDAINMIPQIAGPFDLVFIDADKTNYSRYFDLVFPKLRTGGFIAADNVLWSGRVLEDDQDEDTRALCLFNEKVLADDRVENILLPIRDGLMVIRKKL